MTWTLALWIALFAPGCGEIAPPGEEVAPASNTADDLLSAHMAAEAMLTAHFVATAVKAGMSAEEINGALALVADGSAISEFWISDENGQMVYTNIKGAEFAFPTDPEADTQAAPFARLLTGDQAVVDQGFMSRDLDGMVFKYVGAAGGRPGAHRAGGCRRATG